MSDENCPGCGNKWGDGPESCVACGGPDMDGPDAVKMGLKWAAEKEPMRVELNAAQAVRLQDAFTQHELTQRRLSALTAAVAQRDGFFTLDLEGDKVFLVEVVPDE